MSAPLRTLDDVVTRPAELEARYAAIRDRRAVFLTVYTLMPREMKRRIEAGRFRDSDWVARCTVAFANLYCEAHDTYDRGNSVAKAWATAFDTAGRARSMKGSATSASRWPASARESAVALAGVRAAIH